MQINNVDSQIFEAVELLDQVLNVESVRFTIAMRTKLEKVELILLSLLPHNSGLSS